MKNNDNKRNLLNNLLAVLDESVELINMYDEIPLNYAGRQFYQAETHTIQQIGRQPGITVSEIAENMGKTISACSQIIKKLKAGGAVIQTRNKQNNRQYNLELTDYGWQIFSEHESLDNECYENYVQILKNISVDQLETAITIQTILRDAFKLDVERSLEQNGSYQLNKQA